MWICIQYMGWVTLGHRGVCFSSVIRIYIAVLHVTRPCTTTMVQLCFYVKSVSPSNTPALSVPRVSVTPPPVMSLSPCECSGEYVCVCVLSTRRRGSRSYHCSAAVSHHASGHPTLPVWLLWLHLSSVLFTFLNSFPVSRHCLIHHTFKKV